MHRPDTAPDIVRLTDDILSEAEKYDLCCTIIAADGKTERRLDFGSANRDDVYALDCASGFLLGLSILMLNDGSLLDLAAALTDYISADELPKDAAEKCALYLLCRDAALPDFLHGVLLPQLHRSAEFAALDAEQAAKREQEVLFAHRSLAAQMALLSKNGEPLTSNLAPSPLDEAILAELVRRVSGMSPVGFVRSRILEPLGIVEAVCTSVQQNIEDAVFLTANGLTTLMRAIIDGRLLGKNSMELAVETARGGHTLPFGRRGEILRARSRFFGCTVEIMLDMHSAVSVLVASPEPLPEIRRGDIFARLDIDIARTMSALSVYPSRTRMERLSGKNLPDALELEPRPDQEDYVSAPAAAIADASVVQGEVFVIREGSTAVGLLTFVRGGIPGSMLLDTLIIDRHCQRRGFGRIAVRWAMSYLQKEEISRLTVCVDRRNIAARALYDSLGFELSEVHGSAFVLVRNLS